MSDGSFIPSVLALTVSWSLISSASSHARGIPRFRESLARQDVWPRSFLGPLPYLIAAVELALGGASLVAVIVEAQLTGLLLIGCAILLASYGAFSWRLLRRRPSAPCGCSQQDQPVTAWVSARAWTLSVMALVAAAFYDVDVGSSGPRLGVPLVAIVAAPTLATLLWLLPEALRFDGSTREV
jgi:hypothetical protein